MKEKIEKLRQIGFKRKWLSDRSGYWWQLNIKSKYFEKPCIIVEFNPDILSVECYEPKKFKNRIDSVLIIYRGKPDFNVIRHFIKILK